MARWLKLGRLSAAGCLLLSGFVTSGTPHFSHSPGLPGATQITFGPVSEGAPSVSPDGKQLAFEYFHRRAAGQPEIWIMPLDGGFKLARPLVDNANWNSGPTWSPDGRWISFIRGTSDGPPGHLGIITDQVCKVDVMTGRVVQLTKLPQNASSGDRAVWLRDNRIAFTYDGGIYVVPSNGGRITKLLDVPLPEYYDFAGIAFSPNGKRVAFERVEPSSKPILVTVSLKTGRLNFPLGRHEASFPAWVNNDYLLYSRANMVQHDFEIWATCLSTHQAEKLTGRATDWNPFFSAALGAIFMSRNETQGVLHGFHIWRMPVPKDVIERWFRGSK